jgi:hypothetical protein
MPLMVELEPAKKRTLPSTPKVTRGAGGSGLGGVLVGRTDFDTDP